MSEDVTILTSANHTSLVKTFSGIDLAEQAFATGKAFNPTEEPVYDLQSLSKVLQRLETDPTHTVIRGSPVDDQGSSVPRNKETFTATPRQWCMIDIDSLAWDGDINDQQAMLAHAIQQLPIEFQSVDCWYHFSSSMGIKPGIRMHLWFWLDRPCSDDGLCWLRFQRPQEDSKAIKVFDGNFRGSEGCTRIKFIGNKAFPDEGFRQAMAS